MRKTWKRLEVTYTREAASEPYGTACRSGLDIARLAKDAIRSATKEHFLAFLLDAKNRLIGIHVVSIGTLDAATVHPREVFTPALLTAAKSIVVAHNHPSGDPAPSAEDQLVTDRLRSAGELLGIELLDHVIVGRDRFYCFSEQAYFSF